MSGKAAIAKRPRLYVDEDVPNCLAFVLRARGIRAKTVVEDGRARFLDRENLARAFTLQSVFMTHNCRHFERIHRELRAAGRDHWGIIFVQKEDFKGWPRLQLLANRTVAQLNGLRGLDTQNQRYYLNP